MVLTFKLAVSVGLVALLLVGVKLDLSRLRDRQFTILSWTTLAALRVAVFVVLYLLVGLTPTSDNVTYFAEAKSALAGGVIYRDFESTYGPLATYMNAAAVYLWDSPKSIVLLAILIELASFPLWLHLARRIFDEKAARLASVLYILSPIPFFTTGVSGLNKSLGAAYLGLGIFFLLRNWDGLAGFIMGLAIPGVKFLMMLFTPAAWVFSPQKVRFLIAFLVPLIALYGVLFMLGADLTMPFKMQLNYQTSGNLPFFLGLLGLEAASPIVQRLFDLILLSSLSIIFLIHVFQTRTTKTSWLIHMCSIVGLTFMFFSKKSYTTYLVLFYFPLCLSVARNSFSLVSAAEFGIFNLVATIEPSLLFRWVLNFSAIRIPSLAFLSLVHRNPRYISVIFIVVNLALVSFYCRFLIGTWRVMLQERSEGRSSAVAEIQFA